MQIINWIWTKIKEEKYIILFLAVLAIFRAMHEISKFRIDRSWLPSWDYPFGIKAPPLDSYHVYGGLFVLVLIAGLRLKLRIIGQSVNTWWQSVLIVIVEMYLIYFWIFDWFYHVIFMKPEFMEWKYIFFFIGK